MSDIYVSPTGNAGNPGTDGSPKTLSNANSIAVAGDRTILKAGTYSDPIQPSNSGSSGNHIEYINKSGEQAIIQASGNYDLDITAKDYIKVKASTVSNDYGIVMGGTGVSNLGNNLRIVESKGCIVDGILHQFSDSSSPGLLLSGLTGNYCEDIVIANSKLSVHMHTDWNKGEDAGASDQNKFENPEDSGNGILLDYSADGHYIRNILVTKCIIEKYGSHTPLTLKSGDKILFDQCIMDNDWSDIVDGETVTNANGTVGSCLFLEGSTCDLDSNNAKQGLEGSRAMSAETQRLVGESRLMIQKCVFKKMGYAPDQNITLNKMYWSRGLIHRSNVHYEESKGIGLVSCTKSAGAYGHDIRHQHIYNNTIVRSKNAGLKYQVPSAWANTGVDAQDLHYVNNQHTEMGYRSDLESGTRDSDASLAFDNNGDTDVGDVFNIDCRGNVFDTGADFYVDGHSPTDVNLATLEADYSSNFADNNTGTSTYEGGATTGLDAYEDFELASGSAGLNAGQHLTTTTASGSTTTSIPVAEAGFFFDGWNLSDENGDALVGDVIKVEQSSGDPVATTITSISYGSFGTAAGTLTVSPAVSYPNNAKVYYDYDGAAPNAGILVSSGAPDPEPGPTGNPNYIDTYSNSNDGISLTITPTSTIADDRYLIALITVQENRTVDTPTGWTLEYNGAAGSGNDSPRLYIFSRITSSEPSSYQFDVTFGTIRILGAIMEYENPNTVPLEVEVVSKEETGVTSHNFGALVDTTNLADIIAVTAQSYESALPEITSPSGYTEVADEGITSGAPAFGALNISRKAGAGGTIAATTISSTTISESVNYHIALIGAEVITSAPVLTLPTDAKTGTTTGTGTVTTDEANGTLFFLATVNTTENIATIKAGSSQSVSSTGIQNVTFTGLTAATTYYAHFVHMDDSSNNSNVVNADGFLTDATIPVIILPFESVSNPMPALFIINNTYSLAQHVDNPDGLTLVYSMDTGVLPSGVTLNSATGLLTKASGAVYDEITGLIFDVVAI